MLNDTAAPNGLFTDDGHTARCVWCRSTSEYQRYHDQEWGFPVADDRRLFEKISLEAFQSGLSWRTILAKREHFREAFAQFDPASVATYGPAEVEQLLNNPGIVRHRGKIEATLHNAGRALDLAAEHGSLAAFFWHHEPPADTLPEPQSVTTLPAAVALSKDLKRRGWKFVGPTTVYAFMQAMGLVNDHATGCSVRVKAAVARRAFVVPRS